MAAASVNYLRLKVLLILEGPGAAVLTHTLKCGTHNTPPVDLDWYLNKLPPHSQANYTLLSNTDKKKQFDSSQKNQIRNHPFWDNFDVTLLHKSIFLACERVARKGDPIWQDPNELEGLVTEIKRKRNTIIHEMPSMTEQEFAVTVSGLEDLFARTLRAVQARYNVPVPDTTRVHDEVKSSVDGIKRCFDFEHIWQTGRQQLLHQFRDTSRHHLKSLYQHAQYFDPLCFLSGSPHIRVPVQNIFSKLVVKIQPKDYELNCLDVLSLTQHPPPTQPTNLHTPTQHLTPSTQLLVVSGVAGSGKTTLITFILTEWVKDEQNCPVKHLGTYDLVLRVLCRERDGVSLKEFVELVFPESFVFGCNIIFLLKKCKVLFLIDGLDEVNDTSARLVNDILNHCKIVEGFTAVCTSRPERVEDFLASAPEVCGKCEVIMQRVHPADRTEFVLKQHECLSLARASDPGEVNKLRDLMADIGWRDHLGLPLNLLFLVTIFLDAPHCITNTRTQTSLYVAMHEWCVEKLQYRLATKVQIDRLTREGAVKEVLKMMYLVSLKGLLQDRLRLSEQDIQDLRKCCEAQALPSEELMGAFFSLRKSVTNRVSRASYYAPHKGLQEFFAAQYIVGQLHAGSAEKGVKGLLQDYLQTQPVNIRPQRNLLLHVAGLLSKPEGPSLPRAIEEVVDLLAESGVESCTEWLALLSETEVNEDVLRRVAHYVRGSDGEEDVNVTDTTVFSAKSLLPHVPCHNIVIELTRETRGLDGLSGALAGHNCTHLYLQHHYRNPGQDAASGPLLRHLPDRSHLKQFMGHLDAEHLLLLPRDLEDLALVVTMNSRGRSLLSALENVHENFPELLGLQIHVPVSAVTPSSLTPLPSINTVTLVLSGVGAGEVEAACRLSAAMNPKERGYESILFPGASLGFRGYNRLLEGMAASGVKVHHAVIVPDTIITEDEASHLLRLAVSLLGCLFFRFPAEGVWPTYRPPMSHPLDLYADV